MTSILKNIAAFTVISVMSMLTWSPSAQATVVLTIAQNTFAPVSQEPPSENNSSPTPPASMGTQAPPSYQNPKVYTGTRISLDFQNADIHNIIRIIGEVSGKNIVVSDAITGKVTLKLKDVPWDQALDIVLASRNLGVEDAGNVLTIYDLPTLNNIQAGRLRLAAERAQALALAPLTKRVFTPKYSTTSVVTDALNKLKSGRGKIVSIGNDIYVEDDPGTLGTMAQVFMAIDRVTRQILIEARIIEASSNFTRKLGVSWGAAYASGGLGVADPGAPGESQGVIDVTEGVGSLGFGFLNKANTLLLNAQLSATETSSDARTISAPRIMAANDQEVSIKQGQQIPYQTGGTGDAPLTVEFKDVAMELKVKPHIEENGRVITLEIELTNDTLVLADGATEPTIHTREAKTKLLVKDGETVVIGGIIVDTQSTADNRVPGVHRIPVLGWMFKSRNIINSKAEMLIFITANIIPVNI